MNISRPSWSVSRKKLKFSKLHSFQSIKNAKKINSKIFTSTMEEEQCSECIFSACGSWTASFEALNYN